MSEFFNSFLVKLILTVIISVFIGTQIAKIEFKEYNHSFRKVLGVEQAAKVSDKDLEGKIRIFLEDKEGDYAVYVKDLLPEGKRNVYINSDQSYEAASLYKVFLMAAVYKAVSEGKMSLETEISAKLSHLEAVLGSVDYGYQDLSSNEVATYTIAEALDRVARISDNYAAIMLAEKVGWDSLQEAADEAGATNTVIKTPISTSAEDMGLLLEKIYKGEVVSLQASEAIIELLSKAQINNRIPAKLPKTDPTTGSPLKIAHKTGELSQVRNDAGIVFLNGNPYVIVLMTKNLKGEDEGIENLAEISKIVYDYYASNLDKKEVK
jgi:beta-lactamase class A